MRLWVLSWVRKKEYRSQNEKTREFILDSDSWPMYSALNHASLSMIVATPCPPQFWGHITQFFLTLLGE